MFLVPPTRVGSVVSMGSYRPILGTKMPQNKRKRDINELPAHFDELVAPFVGSVQQHRSEHPFCEVDCINAWFKDFLEQDNGERVYCARPLAYIMPLRSTAINVYRNQVYSKYGDIDAAAKSSMQHSYGQSRRV